MPTRGDPGYQAQRPTTGRPVSGDPNAPRVFPGQGMVQGNAQPRPFMPQTGGVGPMPRQFPGQGMMQGNAQPPPFMGGRQQMPGMGQSQRPQMPMRPQMPQQGMDQQMGQQGQVDPQQQMAMLRMLLQRFGGQFPGQGQQQQFPGMQQGQGLY